MGPVKPCETLGVLLAITLNFHTYMGCRRPLCRQWFTGCTHGARKTLMVVLQGGEGGLLRDRVLDHLQVF